MIYFMQPVDGGPVKIGSSEDVDVRLRQFESHYRRPLVLLGTMPGNAEAERAIHSRFGHLRFGRTEQFRPAPDLMAFIGRPLLVGANPEAVEAMEPETPDTRAIIATLKGSREFRDWLNEAAEADRVSTVQFLEKAAVLYAAHIGFGKPAPKRTESK